nr:MAG TPA: Loader and inhibitor of phage G40P [Siphoviridae sp. ctWyD10]
MEELQIKDLLKTLRSRFPEYYARKEKEEIIEIYNSFVLALSEIEQLAVVGALKDYLSNDRTGYPPTASQLRTKAKAMPEYMWGQMLEEKQQPLAITGKQRTRREILLDCAVCMVTDKTKEELVKWWNEYADNEPLTDEEIEEVWNRVHENKTAENRTI